MSTNNPHSVHYKFRVHSFNEVNHKIDDNGNVATPVFATASYPIYVDFNNAFWAQNGENERTYGYGGDGFFYTRFFRKTVEWDFGDGTKVRSSSARHVYSTAGKYTITCRFYDADGLTHLNKFNVNVVVREVIQNKLAFYRDHFSEEFPSTPLLGNSTEYFADTQSIFCSKISCVAEIEATLGINALYDAPDIIPTRIVPNNGIVSEMSYWDLPNTSDACLLPYYCFLTNVSDTFYNSSSIKEINLQPITKYSPEYEYIWGRVSYNRYSINEEDRIEFQFWRMEKTAVSPEKMDYIDVINPNILLSELDETTRKVVEDKQLSYIKRNDKDIPIYKRVKINHISTVNELPDDAYIVGKRAFVKVYYKSDSLTSKGNETRLSFTYDTD